MYKTAIRGIVQLIKNPMMSHTTTSSTLLAKRKASAMDDTPPSPVAKKNDTLERFKRLNRACIHVTGKIPEETAASALAEFVGYQWPFSRPGTPVILAQTAGWALQNDHLSLPFVIDSVQLMRSILTPIKVAELARSAFDLENGSYFIAPDRWKYQDVSGSEKRRKNDNPTDNIVNESVVKKNLKTIHLDLREGESEHNLAILLNVGPYSRHIVVTDLGLVCGKIKTDGTTEIPELATKISELIYAKKTKNLVSLPSSPTKRRNC